MTLPIIEKIIISSSPVLVSTPFNALGLTTFSETEPKAIWQPPNYVFGLAWPTLYFLLFSLNWNILSDERLTNVFKKKIIKNTLLESSAQGSWLYFFRFKRNIQGRDKSQYIYGLINTTILVGLSYNTLYDIYQTKKNVYLLLYIPYFLWIQFANILNLQLVLGKTK